jgi:DNA-binding NarL/FixJ family response regulator
MSEALCVSVLIVEDHEVMRYSLRKSLESFKTIRVLGEAVNGVDAIEQTRTLKPEIVIMDIGLPELNGIDATRVIKDELPETRVVMLTSFDDEERTCASLAAGADAYCSKQIGADALVRVLQKVSEGSGWLDAAVARHVVKVFSPDQRDSPTHDRSADGDGEGNYDGQSVNPNSPDLDDVVSSANEVTNEAAVDEEDSDTLKVLTKRELQVLRLMMYDHDEIEIAMRMGVTVATVRGYVRKILLKLSQDERTQSYLAYLKY